MTQDTSLRFREFKMPDVGEGLTEAEILKWYVQPGDTVTDGQVVCEVETAKAAVELPIPYDGVVHELRFEEGTTVDVGTSIITVDVQPGGGDAAPARAARAQTPAAPVAPAAEENDEPKGRQPVLVGYGVVRGVHQAPPPQGHRRPSRQQAAAARRDPGRDERPRRRVRPRPQQPPPARWPSPRSASSPRTWASTWRRSPRPGPTASSPARTSTRRPPRQPAPAVAGRAGPGRRPRRPCRSRAGARETRIPIKGVRKATAAAMVGSAFTAPHVTEFITLDVTRTMKLVDELKADKDMAGLRVNPLLLIAKALLVAIKRNPEVNAAWDEANQEIVQKHYVNLGIAAATPRGLIVPNIKDAHDKTLPELAQSLGELVATAREGKTTPAAMQGGTVTITNVGVFGVDTGTPILNPGESAILAVGAIKLQPWVHKGKVKPRQVTTLALSFDHRLVDGELGSKVLADVAAVLENPKRLITWA